MQLTAQAVVVDRPRLLRVTVTCISCTVATLDARCNMRHQGECERPAVASASRYRNGGASLATGSVTSASARACMLFICYSLSNI